jgi:lysophospholipase L1-like esterase
LSDKKQVPGITYNAIGVNGAGTYSYLRCQDFDKQIHGIVPDVVVFGIGVNDANVPEADFNPSMYEARYDSLIYKIRETNPDCAFLFITNNDTYYQKKHPNRNAFQVQATMRRLAEKHGGALYDLFDVMGGLGSITQWKNANLASSDLIHLTREGYELQGDMMFTAIRNALGDYMDSIGLP